MKNNLFSGQDMLLCNTISWSNHMNNALTWEISTSDELFIKKKKKTYFDTQDTTWLLYKWSDAYSFAIYYRIRHKMSFHTNICKTMISFFQHLFRLDQFLIFLTEGPYIESSHWPCFYCPALPPPIPEAISPVLFFFFSDNILSVLSWYIRHVLSIIQRNRI